MSSKHSRNRGHHEAEDGQEAQVDAGHVPGILCTLSKPLPNPLGSIRTQRREVPLSGPQEGSPSEDSL